MSRAQPDNAALPKDLAWLDEQIAALQFQAFLRFLLLDARRGARQPPAPRLPWA